MSTWKGGFEWDRRWENRFQGAQWQGKLYDDGTRRLCRDSATISAWRISWAPTILVRTRHISSTQSRALTYRSHFVLAVSPL